MAELIDYSYDRFTAAELKAAGKAGAIRYVASGRPEVSATRAEVDGIRAGGLAFVAVWERGPARALAGYPAGKLDAADAAAYCAGLGASSTDPAYFAVDFDATPAQMPTVAAYVEGVASVLGWDRVGVYGGLPVLEYLRARTPLALFWQTIAWSGDVLLPYANLYQYRINDVLNGKEVDLDRALTADYGQWGRMTLKSSPRGPDPVIWVVIHTAEGPYDDNPANPGIDPGSVDQLRNYFADPNTQASCHAGADDDQLSDGWVPYDRAAWTLRNGNPISDNLEMCGRAGWTREQWLQHPGLVRNAARWAASRCQARGIPVRRLTVAQVAARNVPGILDHNTYTVATGDGTHWDVGPGFPWDVFLADVNQFMQGGTPEDEMSAADVAAIRADIKNCQDTLYNLTRAQTPEGKPDPGHAEMAVTTANGRLTALAKAVGAIGTQVGALSDDEAKLLAAEDAATAKILAAVQTVIVDPQVPNADPEAFVAALRDALVRGEPPATS